MEGRSKPGNIETTIVIGSGKGGVGKTTVSLNLALALLMKGRKVALLDADLYGPNIPLMLGVRRTKEPQGMAAFWPVVRPGQKTLTPEVKPLERFGLRVMSAGFLISEDQAVRAGTSLMIGKLIESLIYIVDWGDADIIIIDLPPGSDEPLATIAASTELTAGIVVTTPQDVARLDARREIKRFEGFSLPLMGIVENMSFFICAHCGERQEVFHRGDRFTDLDAPLLARVPLAPEISAASDLGRPLLLTGSDSPANSAFLELADEVLSRLPAST